MFKITCLCELFKPVVNVNVTSNELMSCEIHSGAREVGGVTCDSCEDNPD